MNKTARVCLSVVLLLFWAAQPGAAQSEGKPIATAQVDLSVPESPAFTVLGLTPETVIRPASPREFATAILNGVDRNGNFHSGVALDSAPYLLLAGNQVTIRAYRESLATRLLSRTKVSIATAQGASEGDKSTRLAAGVHLTFWDKGDARMDSALTKCFDEVLQFGPPISPTLTDKERELEMAKRQEVLKVKAQACREKSRKANWNRSSWVVGAAPSWISLPGNIRKLKWDGGALWSSLAYGFERVPKLEQSAQLILHARYRNNEEAPDIVAKGTFIRQNSTLAGGRLRVSPSNPDYAFSLEGVLVHTSPANRKADNSYRISLDLERKLTQDLWLAVSVGGESGRKDGNNQAFVLTSFKWGFSRQAELVAPGQ